MPRDSVQVHGHVSADASAVWSVLRDFCAPWHPWIASMREERDLRGSLIRAFTVKGEATLYREQRTYLSDSDHVMAYTHLEGIAGAQSYDARVTVTPSESGGCTVLWTAQIEAPAARLRDICDGTRAVYQAGIDALRGASAPVGGTTAPRPAPVPVTTRLIDDLPRLAVSVTPELGDGRLCLFLHGIGGGRTNWAAQLGAAGHHIRSAAMDLRGYGDSTLGPRQSSVDDYCADILRVAEVLGARRLVLVGLSYGSWIATSFAMRYPEMLDGLVLSGGCTGMSEAGPEEREAFRVSREVPLNAGQSPADFAPAVVKVLAGPSASERVRQDLLASMSAIPVPTYRDALLCFTNPVERFDFSRLDMPVLMMTGEHDRLAPPSEIRSVAGRIWDSAKRPDVRFEVIADAGHVCNVEQPDSYSDRLCTFLAGLAK
ncbi:alpha/beta fold hydrolase [Paragemmobacter straminiformis]|uniref:Alpha/beta fold hydrolase n=1 Tax=Paragemmobacter straminiformis TaxID=2045119 RepID=A0A842IA24_9RHOB|nr:alpha/beta fold hydrolase [Gemmobacter straminiformis]MBC2836710.1 alpha/beta fold hydrolase [Gemmobacter straminiformis]